MGSCCLGFGVDDLRERAPPLERLVFGLFHEMSIGVLLGSCGSFDREMRVTCGHARCALETRSAVTVSRHWQKRFPITGTAGIVCGKQGGICLPRSERHTKLLHSVICSKASKIHVRWHHALPIYYTHIVSYKRLSGDSCCLVPVACSPSFNCWAE